MDSNDPLQYICRKKSGESSVANMKELVPFSFWFIISGVTRQSKAIILHMEREQVLSSCTLFAVPCLPNIVSYRECIFFRLLYSPRLLSVVVNALICWDVDKKSLCQHPNKSKRREITQSQIRGLLEGCSRILLTQSEPLTIRRSNNVYQNRNKQKRMARWVLTVLFATKKHTETPHKITTLIIITLPTFTWILTRRAVSSIYWLCSCDMSSREDIECFFGGRWIGRWSNT